MTVKLAHKKQVQASEHVFRTDIGLDESTYRLYKMILRYSREVLGMNLSQSVVFRAGIAELFLSTIEQIYEASAGAKDKAERLNKLMEFHELNRQKFLRAAGKESTLPDPIEALMD